MRLAILAALAALAFVASTTLAAEPPPAKMKGEQTYVERVLAMPDTAAAHADLARWCAANSLPDRAKIHWEEALVRDADHADARAALGYVRRGGEWVAGGSGASGSGASGSGALSLGLLTPSAAPPANNDRGSGAQTTGLQTPALPQTPAAQEPPAPPDVTFRVRQREYLKQIQDIARRLLIPTDLAAWKEGRLQILMLRDPAAVEPLVRTLSGGTIEVRMLVAETLGQIPSDEAQRHLIALAIGDPSPAVNAQAVSSLEQRDDPRAVQQLIYALARGQEATMLRAARALGSLGAWDAVPALIAKLRSVVYRTVTVTELRQAPARITLGGLFPYVADVRPVVAPGVVAYDPVIGYLMPGGFRVPAEPAPPVEVQVQKTESQWAEQPDILDALKKITGRDLGYDQAEWRRWLGERERERAAKP